MDFGPKNFKICTKYDSYIEYEGDSGDDKNIIEYNFSAEFSSKNFKIRRDDIISEEVNFIGVAFSFHNFSNKNKIQLIKFLQSNIKTALLIKDSVIKNQKIMSLLLITSSIVDKLNTELHDIITITNDIIMAIQEICLSCWNINQNHIRALLSVIYAKLFRFSKTVEYHDILIK